jgi:hypothetical protein
VKEKHPTLNPNQRQRLLTTCKHIDALLGDIEEILYAAEAKSAFPNYVNDVPAIHRGAIENYVARLRRQLLQELAGQSLAPEEPHILVSHAIHVRLSFIEIALAELAPLHMRGYGPVSEEGATDLDGLVAELQSAVKELDRYILQLRPAASEEKENNRLTGEGRSGVHEFDHDKQ